MSYRANIPGCGPGKCPVCGREVTGLTLNIVDFVEAGVSVATAYIAADFEILLVE